MFEICCIFNYPSHYRSCIYQLMEQKLDCDFFFGDIDKKSIKKMEYTVFQKKPVDFHTFRLGAFNWISGSVTLVFKHYKKYVLTGDILCISNWLILIFSKIAGKETYIWTHGWYGDETKGKIFLKKMFFGLSSGVFLYGDYAKNLMIKNGICTNKLHVVYNSMDYHHQLTVRNSLGTSSVFTDYFRNNYPVIIFSGRLNKEKKLELLIETHHRLYQLGYYYNIILIGDGTEMESLKKKVNALNMGRHFWFYGACYDENIIGDFYFQASICISPGNIGLTAIHSIMYGCPVITHSDFCKQGPEFEVIERGKTGEFFIYDDINSLISTIISWGLRHPQKKESLVKDCFRKVDEKYNPNYQIEVFKSVLIDKK